MSPEVYLAYLLACVVMTIVPGPTVTLVVANSLTHGTRAGLLNVAGTQLALGADARRPGRRARLDHRDDGLVVRLAAARRRRLSGLARLAAAARARAGRASRGRVPAPRGGFFLQGFLVMLSNPKVLLFFGAFIPQFVDPRADHVAAGGAARRHRHGGRDGLRRRLCGR